MSYSVSEFHLTVTADFQLTVYFCTSSGFPGGASGEEPARQCRRRKRRGFDPRVGKIHWRRAWQLTPVFLPEESHGQWDLMSYSPQGCRKLDMTEAIQHTHTYVYTLVSQKYSVIGLCCQKAFYFVCSEGCCLRCLGETDLCLPIYLSDIYHSFKSVPTCPSQHLLIWPLRQMHPMHCNLLFLLFSII